MCFLSGIYSQNINNITSCIGARVIIKVSGHQHQWLAGSYDLVIGHF